LLAHELAHAVQQAGGEGSFVQRSPATPKETKAPKPQILKIVAFEGDEKNGVAYVAHPADPDLAQEAATVPEAIDIVKNDLKAGEYKLQRDEKSPKHYK